MAWLLPRSLTFLWCFIFVEGYYPPHRTKEYTEDSDGGSGCFFSELCTKCEESAALPSNVNSVRHVVVRIGKQNVDAFCF